MAAVELQLDLGFVGDDDDGSGGGWFDSLVAINQRWLGNYARVNPTFGVSLSLLERNSLWMNTYFQKHRMITSPLSKQAKSLLQQHQQTVLLRLRSGGGSRLSEAEGSTLLVEPMAALMFAASVDRCPEYQIESLLSEAMELLQSHSLREQALRAGFAGCVFRFLTTFSEHKKRVLTLQLLVLLASHDAAAVVHSCKVAAQGQLWQPNMYIYTLQKRHHDHEEIRELAAELISHFATEMPITSPIHLEPMQFEMEIDDEERLELAPLSPPPTHRAHTLPALGSPSTKKPTMSPHRPTTTISSLYVGMPSPYSRNVVLPIARPPPSAAEQTRRSHIYSTPKEKAIAGDRKRRCLTPNIQEIQREPSEAEDLGWMNSQAGSPPRSPTSPRGDKKPITISEKYSWNPECINSVSGFEWWWRSLPQHHSNLEPTQKLKMVTKAAVRLHTKGEWERAVELYLLALSMDINDEVQFRLRVNLGCAYEVGLAFSACEAEFRAALLINPEDPYARFKLGSALKELGRFDEAKAAFDAVVHVYPQAEDALKQLEEARAERLKQEESERNQLASDRTARSPTKPGRRLHSRGNGASLPRIAQPSSPATSPRQLSSPRVEPLQSPSGSYRDDPLMNADLISCVVTRSQEKKADLRDALQQIDVDGTGRIRLAALAKLVSALCDVDESVFHGWLPHESVSVDGDGLVQYETLLQAVDCDAKNKSSQLAHHTKHWNGVVQEIKLQEAGFYDAVKRSKDEPRSEFVVDKEGKQKTEDGVPLADKKPERHGEAVIPSSDEGGDANEGPSASDLHAEEADAVVVSLDAAPASKDVMPSESAVDAEPALYLRRASVEELGGYHSVTARLGEKREKARHEAILRAERSRVVARKHLHCLRTLKEIATHARRHLLKQHEARERLVAVESDARSQCRLQWVPAVAAVDPAEPASVSASADPESRPYTPVEEAEEARPYTPVESTEEVVVVVDEPPASELSVVSFLCQRLVDVAMASAARNVAVSRSVSELQTLAASTSAVCGLVPELLLQAAQANSVSSSDA